MRHITCTAARAAISEVGIPAPQPGRFPTWLIVLLLVAGASVFTCCIGPFIVGMLLPKPDPAVVKAAQERKKSEKQIHEIEQKRQAEARLARQREAQEQTKKIEAWSMAEQFITDRLKSPSTADFGSVSGGTYQDPTTCVTKLDGGDYLVRGWVDSQNAFGATVRVNFVAKLREQAGGKWRLVEEPVMVQR